VSGQDLESVIARKVHLWESSGASDGDGACEACLATVREFDLVPAIVAFVEGWIIARPGRLPVPPEDFAWQWREDMS
jgi:hypothetical protein